jgi:hypothetical protein
MFQPKAIKLGGVSASIVAPLADLGRTKYVSEKETCNPVGLICSDNVQLCIAKKFIQVHADRHICQMPVHEFNVRAADKSSQRHWHTVAIKREKP